MMIQNLLVATALLSVATASPVKGKGPKGPNPLNANKNKPPKDGYKCVTDRHPDSSPLNIAEKFIDAAISDAGRGGFDAGLSGFPHPFGGTAGSGGAQLQFPGASSGCNAEGRELLEFPVFSVETFFDKTKKRQGGGTPTPARAIFLKDGTKCGVITHETEGEDGRGSGDFKVCNPV